MQPLIQSENLTFSYQAETESRQIPVLKDVSLSFSQGDFVAILGHNGSGKSTFAKLLNVILTPTGGTLTVAGHQITSKEFTEDDLFDVRRAVGMVFQNPDNQLVATVVEEDVAFGPENLGIPPEEIRIRVDEALRTVGMSAYAKQAPHRLSGGQKQRVAIAGIIAMMPKCIIFDESTAMLDPLGRREVMETMQKLNHEYGITILHITHFMEEAVLADRVVVINDGTVYLDGTPKEVFSHVEELESVGLEVPQGTLLVHSLRRSGYDLPHDCLTEDECVDAILSLFGKEKAHG